MTIFIIVTQTLAYLGTKDNGEIWKLQIIGARLPFNAKNITFRTVLIFKKKLQFFLNADIVYSEFCLF